MADNQTQFPLDMQSEGQSHPPQPEPRGLNVDTATSQEIAAKIGEMMRAQGIDGEANPVAAEKIQRDLEYQRQMETFPQPDSAPLPSEVGSPEAVDRLEQLQRELDAAKSEATRWKKEFGRREGTVGQMKNELADLKARVSQIQPAINVQQITGRAPDEPITAQDAVNLLINQSSAFGNAMRALEERLMSQAANSNDGALPLDMEAELVEAHPWLTDLPRPQKMRAMHDILASSGVTVAPPAPVAMQATPPPATLPAAARAPLRQVAFIEPSNRGSAPERAAMAPERQALNEKVAKYHEALSRPGGAEEAAKILASLGAGPVDETQVGYMRNRR